MYLEYLTEDTFQSIFPNPASEQVAAPRGTKYMHGVSSARASAMGLIYILDDPPAAQPILPNSHLPKQNWADSGTPKFKANPTQVHDTLYYNLQGDTSGGDPGLG